MMRFAVDNQRVEDVLYVKFGKFPTVNWKPATVSCFNREYFKLFLKKIDTFFPYIVYQLYTKTT